MCFVLFVTRRTHFHDYMRINVISVSHMRKSTTCYKLYKDVHSYFDNLDIAVK